MRKKSNYFEKGKIETWIERLLNDRYASKARSKEKNCENGVKSVTGTGRAFEGKDKWEKSECIDKAENKLEEDSWRNMEGNPKYTGGLLKVY